MSAASEVMLLITSCDRVSGSQEVPPEIDAALVRFWSHVDRSAGPDACWPWTGAPSRGGYGRFKFVGRSLYAHRIACMVAHGAPPAADSQACHDPRACITRLCCNQKHLRWDSLAGNQRDVRIAGTRRGTLNNQAKLTEAQALEVWRRRDEGGYAKLARTMGLPTRAVCGVLHGTNWAWLTGATAATKPKDQRLHLSEGDVAQIRSAGAAIGRGGQALIGRRFGVSSQYVGRILRGQVRRTALANAILDAAEATP